MLMMNLLTVNRMLQIKAKPLLSFNIFYFMVCTPIDFPCNRNKIDLWKYTAVLRKRDIHCCKWSTDTFFNSCISGSQRAFTGAAVCWCSLAISIHSRTDAGGFMVVPSNVNTSTAAGRFQINSILSKTDRGRLCGTAATTSLSQRDLLFYSNPHKTFAGT